MSSTPFCLGLAVVDSFEYKGQDCAFVLRAKNEKEMSWRINEILYNLPNTKELLVYVIGYRPNYPIPTTKFFVEAAIRDADDYGITLFGKRFKGRKEV